MIISLKEVAGLIGGKITGDENVEITNLAKIEEANPGELTFLYLPAYEKYFAGTKASAILVKPGFNKTRSDKHTLKLMTLIKHFQKFLFITFSPEFSFQVLKFPHRYIPSAVIGKNVAAWQRCRRLAGSG